MKSAEEIVKGLEADIKNSNATITKLAPNSYLHGDAILKEQVKIKFATNLINWIKS